MEGLVVLFIVGPSRKLLGAGFAFRTNVWTGEFQDAWDDLLRFILFSLSVKSWSLPMIATV
jgi:hypothetical protein